MSPEHVKREKAKARELRRSRWWTRQCEFAHCYYCRVALPRDQVTMDHVVAIQRGGRSTKDNLVTCCRQCNQQKSDTNIVDFLLNR